MPVKVPPNPENSRGPENEVRLEDLDGFLEATRHLMEQLLQVTRSLPSVDENGQSDCPEAEEMYAEKEELQAQLQGHFEQLHRYEAFVEEELKRCEGDLVVLEEHQKRLHTDKPRAHYSQAEVEVAAMCKKLRKMLREIKAMIKAVDEVLAEAVQKRFPGKIPQKWPHMDFAPPSANRSQAEKDVDDLIRMGPRPGASSTPGKGQRS